MEKWMMIYEMAEQICMAACAFFGILSAWQFLCLRHHEKDRTEDETYGSGAAEYHREPDSCPDGEAWTERLDGSM